MTFPERSIPATPSDPKTVRWSLAGVAVAYFTSTIIFGAMAVALPRIAAELDGMRLFSRALALPSLAIALGTLLAGKLSDLYGRRALLILSMGLYLLGALLSAVSQTFEFLIAALRVMSLGQGAIAPLSFAVIGDLFDGDDRSRWAGLMNIPNGIAALIAPILAGWLVDNYSWRYLFGGVLPLILITIAVIALGLPGIGPPAKHKLDLRGSLLLTAAATTMLVGLSWAGATYAWFSIQIVGLLGLSILLWGVFLKIEASAAEPMLDPQVLLNRTFITAALSALISIFGLIAITSYLPLFLQSVQGTSATLSGQIAAPYGVLSCFMAFPIGFLLAHTGRDKWLFIASYGLLSVTLVGLALYRSDTPTWFAFAITAAAGFAMGSIPTTNTLVAQHALPRRLLGAATGGMYFFVMLGRAAAPAVLGSAMNVRYALSLQGRLPPQLTGDAARATLTSLADPRVLLSAQAMQDLEARLAVMRDAAPTLYAQTTQAIRTSLESGLREVFLIGAIAMLISFLLILTIPDRSLRDASAGDQVSTPREAG
jgi:MFS family permease